MNEQEKLELLKLLNGEEALSADDFKQLIMQLETYDILVKVFILEGTPFVFGNSPMKYVIFKEQVADRFGVGSQDVRIVGSARLGFSPSPHKYGKPFSETSDVDVVIVSESLFHRGSRELFREINLLGPALYQVRNALETNPTNRPTVDLNDWKTTKEAIRNYVYQNFNPGLLNNDNSLKQNVFSKISSTAGLFLALEPRVFVSKIRCRIFRDWKASEEYYTNSIRELSKFFEGDTEIDAETDEQGEIISLQNDTQKDLGGKN